MATGGLIPLLRRFFEDKKSVDGSTALELEARFGTASGHQLITKQQHDAVIRKFLGAGYVLSSPANYLRVSTKDGIRLEVSGYAGIAAYCRDNDPAALLATGQAILVEKQKLCDPFNAPDYQFRVGLSTEKKQHDGSGLTGWPTADKSFRLIERSTLAKDGYPFQIDVSVTRQSTQGSLRTFAQARLERQVVRYEVEIEVLPLAVGVATPFETPEQLSIPFKQTIMTVLSALQGSNFPIPFSLRRRVLEDYCVLTKQKVSACRFIGPSPISLQVDNLAPINANARIPNIRDGYTVTDKADGARKLMFVDKEGHIYLIDTNLSVQFTGSVTQNKEMFNSIYDGEHIENSKTGHFINLFACFDIYVHGGKSVSRLPFAESTGGVTSRLSTMVDSVERLALTSTLGKGQAAPLRCVCKVFHLVKPGQIANASAFVLDRGETLEYETDGLIFTPAELAVGASAVGRPAVLGRTWEMAFKWKPPRYNTIDFLVSVQKTRSGQPEVKNLFQKGTNVTRAVQGTSYKTLVLKVGFDDAKHGYLDPCAAVRDRTLPTGPQSRQKRSKYRPVQFFPTNPSDSGAGLTNIALVTTSNGQGIMVCEEGDLIEDNTIVEFRYDFGAEPGWHWKPLRVRYDKTAKLRAGQPSYGNAYHVANSNWHSIHNPVTEEMIRTGTGIGDELAGDDIYYSSLSTKSYTKSLRDFHNLWVKRRLITGAAKPGQTLIDLACGRGGDLPKWIAAGLQFVYGLDLVDDNISNRLDGACARYLNYAKKMRRIPQALFGVGNATLNIRDGTGIPDGMDQAVNMAVFGIESEKELPVGVKSAFGYGRDGFDVCSIQFALHYMFKNLRTLNECLRNITEVTKIGGYFIGTCYDGAKIFRMLNNTAAGQSVSKAINDVQVWGVTKQYGALSFPNDSASVGFAIDVYQETIGKTFREYLVNMQYLRESMDAYGFATLTEAELAEVKLPASIGSFRALYDDMMRQAPNTRLGEARLLAGPQMDISFLNSFFIFKKVRNVDAAAISKNRIGETPSAESIEKAERAAVQSAMAQATASAARSKVTFTRTGRSLVLTD